MVVAVILSGGQSSRMGSDKSQLMINGDTLLEHMQKLLINCDIQTIRISNNEHIQDTYTNKGPLAGLLASLEHLDQHPYVLFVPIDMPLLTTEIIWGLIKEKPQTINHYTGQNLPLIIKNSKRMRNLIENQINDEKLSIYQLLIQVQAKEINNSHSNRYFMNTNTPEQWQKAILLLQEQSP